jgi:hypothetical protein
LLNSIFLLAHRNRYSEGMDDGQKTPRGYPNFNSYFKNLHVLVFQMDVWTDGQRRTFAARGLEELFSSYAVVSVFCFWREIGFGVTYLRTSSTIKLWHCVHFLVLAGNSFWCYIRTSCTVQLCSCVSFLVVVGNSSQNENTFDFL